MPVYPFPRWLRCTRCNLLAPVDRERFHLDVDEYRPDRARYVHEKCHGPPPKRGTRTVSHRVPGRSPRRFPLGGVRPPRRTLPERTDPGVARGRQGQPRHRCARHVQGVRRRATRPGSVQHRCHQQPPTLSGAAPASPAVRCRLRPTNPPPPARRVQRLVRCLPLRTHDPHRHRRHRAEGRRSLGRSGNDRKS